MKNSEIVNLEIIERKAAAFNQLMSGAQTAKIANWLLIAFSVVLLYFARENILHQLALLVGIIFEIYYTIKYLNIDNIDRNLSSELDLKTNFSKFKTYIERRKKNEYFFLLIWIVSCVPAASQYFTSGYRVAIAAISYTAFVGTFGYLAFKSVDKKIGLFETENL